MARFAAICALGGLTAGCFQPLYGQRSVDGGPGVRDLLSSVDVKPIAAANGTPEARLGVEVRNQLIFDLTGGGSAPSPTHQLTIKLSSAHAPIIVDVTTARAEVENYALNASYTLTDAATGKVVVTGQTFARVSFDTPGQQQRFVTARALRDAENRAAKQIADNIQSRLASYFVAGG